VHKSVCAKYGRALNVLSAEESKLRRPNDTFGGWKHSAFEECLGHFWGILDTRPYMRARYAAFEALQKIPGRESLQLQLCELQDMLRLCRGDNMGVRYQVPALLLRLNRDQECYDFLKWYQTTGQKPDYDWGNMELGFLDIKDADAFEELDKSNLAQKYIGLAFVASATILKIKLLLDLLRPDGEEIASPVAKKIRLSLTADRREELIARLKSQVKTLYEATKRENEHYWPALISNPEQHLTARPQLYSRGSKEDMQLSLQYTYFAWKETSGSLELIKVIRQDSF
jgi:hypothetical protein